MGSIWSGTSSIDELQTEVKSILRQGVSSITPDQGQVGSEFNSWRKPVAKFARHEAHLAEIIRTNIREYDISDKLWEKSCGIVDAITQFFHDRVKNVTSMYYPCLKFGDFVKQGSSREGLKIRHPDEFDMILPFEIEDLDIRAVPARDRNGDLIPGHIKLQISDPDQIYNARTDKRYQSLRRNDVFEDFVNRVYLNAMCFQMQVISSIMDETIAEIQKQIDLTDKCEECSFTLRKTSVFPPTYRFKITITSVEDFDEFSYGQETIDGGRVTLQAGTIEYETNSARPPVWNDTHKEIEFDIVPGLLLQSDYVPDPESWCFPMKCERYAVMKWIHKGRDVDEYVQPDLIWRVSTCGYEKHILDVSSRNQNDVYILTACRVFKAYLDSLGHSSQLSSLLSSYHIKNIAIHCILLQLDVAGVREALGYIIAFLEIVLEQNFLPHYFYGNPYISNMFPKLSTNASQRRLNLFRKFRPSDFEQALISLRRVKGEINRLFPGSSDLGNYRSILSFTNLCSPDDESKNY